MAKLTTQIVGIIYQGRWALFKINTLPNDLVLLLKILFGYDAQNGNKILDNIIGLDVSMINIYL